MIANRYLLLHKYIRVVDKFAELAVLSLRDALDIFYKSEIYVLMNEGISDMHCRSDEYLAEELLQEISVGTKAPPAS
jgi:hypothetical protein